MMYVPASIDTHDVKLSEELLSLTERIAEHGRDVWAERRISEGWRYGKVRNPETKVTALLAPYNGFSEKEKEYDRRTALETLKKIIKLGHNIVDVRKVDANANI